jgi:hypothetical protein
MTEFMQYNWFVDGHPKQKVGTYEMFWPIKCSYVVGDWIETQEVNLWAIIGQHHQSNYIISEQLLVILNLKYPGRT